MSEADPFVNQPPCFTPLARTILNGLEAALKQHASVQRSVDCEANLKRVIGGTGQGQGKERSDKLTGSEREPARAAGYHCVFCSHHVPYYRPCTKCRRDKIAAARNIDIVLKSLKGAAFFTK